MAKLNNEPEEFFDIIMIFLFDMMINQDYSLLKREDIQELLRLFEKKGLKVPLKQHYMSLKNQRRVEYKRIKEAFFNPKSPMHTINIVQKKDGSVDESVDESVDLEFFRIKDLVRKVILNMKKAKYNKPGKIITDLQLDKIITKTIISNKTRDSDVWDNRKPRFLNRSTSKRKGRLPPSVQWKIDAHIRLIEYIKTTFLLISETILETTAFDTQKQKRYPIKPKDIVRFGGKLYKAVSNRKVSI